MSGDGGGLPEGWAWATLHDISESVRNGIYVSRPGSDPDGVPILRISAVRPLRLDLSDLRYSGRTVEELQSADHLVLPGDLLFTRYNGNRELVGACTAVPDSAPALTYPDKLIRVRVNRGIVDPRYVAYSFAWDATRDLVRAHVKTTAGQAGIAGGELKKISIPIPSLAEQRRIVMALEEQLSRLEAAQKSLQMAVSRLRNFKRSLLLDLIPDPFPVHWERSTVAEAGRVDLGRQRHPDWHHGPEMRPYLRVANVFEDRIDTRDVKEMDFSGVFEKFRLSPGDVLLNEGQSPELIGRPAIYQGEPPDVAFTNSLLRFRGRADVIPEWALLVFRRHMHVGRFKKEARITTNIGHLSSARLKKIEFPIPSVREQEYLVKLASDRLGALDRLTSELARRKVQGDFLRRSLLGEAFAGRLVPQDPDDEPADALLARIQAGRAAAPQQRRGRRAAPAPRAASDPPAPATTPTTPLTGVQTAAFDLEMPSS